MSPPKPVSTYLCRYSLSAGALVTGLLMSAVFATCGFGFASVLSTWNSTSHSALTDLLGSDPHTHQNELLEHAYPEGIGLSSAVFLAYSVSSVFLVCGVCLGRIVLVKAFVVSSVVVIVLCLIGLMFIFIDFTWYHRRQLALAVTFMTVWYVWWVYSFLVVLSYLIDAKSNSRVTTAGT